MLLTNELATCPQAEVHNSSTRPERVRLTNRRSLSIWCDIQLPSFVAPADPHELGIALLECYKI